MLSDFSVVDGGSNILNGIFVAVCKSGSPGMVYRSIVILVGYAYRLS